MGIGTAVEGDVAVGQRAASPISARPRARGMGSSSGSSLGQRRGGREQVGQPCDLGVDAECRTPRRAGR